MKLTEEQKQHLRTMQYCFSLVRCAVKDGNEVGSRIDGMLTARFAFRARPELRDVVAEETEKASRRSALADVRWEKVPIEITEQVWSLIKPFVKEQA